MRAILNVDGLTHQPTTGVHTGPSNLRASEHSAFSKGQGGQTKFLEKCVVLSSRVSSLLFYLHQLPVSLFWADFFVL